MSKTQGKITYKLKQKLYYSNQKFYETGPEESKFLSGREENEHRILRIVLSITTNYLCFIFQMEWVSKIGLALCLFSLIVICVPQTDILLSEVYFGKTGQNTHFVEIKAKDSTREINLDNYYIILANR